MTRLLGPVGHFSDSQTRISRQRCAWRDDNSWTRQSSDQQNHAWILANPATSSSNSHEFSYEQPEFRRIQLRAARRWRCPTRKWRNAAIVPESACEL